MSDPVAASDQRDINSDGTELGEKEKASMSRKEKRKAAKKQKRKQRRKEEAEKVREEEEARMIDPEEQRRFELMEQEEMENSERARQEFEERERAWMEKIAEEKKKREDEEERRKEDLEESMAKVVDDNHEADDWEYVEDGPAEIIWKGNEIIVKKKKVKIPKRNTSQLAEEDSHRPTSNPLPPQSEVFSDYNNLSAFSSSQHFYEDAAQQVPNFGTEQDKAHCPFHFKTGTCRFGQRCSRAHFYPDKSCTLLMKNMYNGPGLTWEQDEGLEHTDEEIERCYEEFYEDVHTEFLKCGELVNFKVCKNGAFHLRGNVYVQYKCLSSAILAYQSINGRYFGGKQVKCEFVNLSRWKVAICGEYMKSRFRTCSHGSACNFIHCFRNPGGDYEWADWDKPAPRYWIRKMVALFGFSDEYGCEKQIDKMPTADTEKRHVKRSRSREINGRDSPSHRNQNHHEYSDSTVHQKRHRSDHRKHLHGKAHDERVSSSGRNTDRDRHHCRTRKRSRYQKEAADLEEHGDYAGTVPRTRNSDASSNGEDHHRKGKSSRSHWSEEKRRSSHGDERGHGRSRKSKREKHNSGEGDDLDVTRSGEETRGDDLKLAKKSKSASSGRYGSRKPCDRWEPRRTDSEE